MERICVSVIVGKVGALAVFFYLHSPGTRTLGHLEVAPVLTDERNIKESGQSQLVLYELRAVCDATHIAASLAVKSPSSV